MTGTRLYRPFLTLSKYGSNTLTCGFLSVNAGHCGNPLPFGSPVAAKVTP